jgi:PD-(D/E)XK nuclease superfamily
MEIVKTAAAKPAPFNFTYTKLKDFETCPRRYHEMSVLKNWVEEKSEHLEWGRAVHDAMAARLTLGVELPANMRGYQPWIDKVLRTPGDLYVEDQCKYAITRAFRPCDWFGPHVWMRCIADAVKVDDDLALAIDWKTGKSSNQDPVQLAIVALMVFIHFPKVLRVRADYVFLQDDAQTSVVMDRHEAADEWVKILERVAYLERATERGEFPPKPNRLCRSWCPVRSCCYWGK